MKVYNLCFPDGVPFYIGATADVEKRRQQHISIAVTGRDLGPKGDVIRSIYEQGKEPRLVIVGGDKRGVDLERMSILSFNGLLTNGTSCPPYKRWSPCSIDRGIEWTEKRLRKLYSIIRRGEGRFDLTWIYIETSIFETDLRRLREARNQGREAIYDRPHAQ